MHLCLSGQHWLPKQGWDGGALLPETTGPGTRSPGGQDAVGALGKHAHLCTSCPGRAPCCIQQGVGQVPSGTPGVQGHMALSKGCLVK